MKFLARYNILISLVFIILIVSCYRFKTSLPVNKDDTNYIQHLINTNDTVILKRGHYYVSNLKIPSNKVLRGVDSGVVLQKIKASLHEENESIIHVIGSDSEISSLKLIGNIDRDEGEWNHGIALIPVDQDIRNIHLRKIHVQHTRGDGIYIGTRNYRYKCQDISIDSITVYNCYRNGISITSGSNIHIKTILVEQSGMLGIDLEMNPQNVLPLDQVSISNFKIANIGVIGIPENLCSNIRIENGILEGQYAGANPKYKETRAGKNAITLRNSNKVIVREVEMINHPNMAIAFVHEQEDTYCDSITFENINQENISFLDSIYNTYNFTVGVHQLIFKNFLAKHIPIGKSFICGSSNDQKSKVILNNSDIKGGILARYTTIEINNVKHSTEDVNVQALFQGSILKNSTLEGRINTAFSSLQIKNTKLAFREKSSHMDYSREIIP